VRRLGRHRDGCSRRSVVVLGGVSRKRRRKGRKDKESLPVGMETPSGIKGNARRSQNLKGSGILS
jgi:hypothetical protein